MLTSTYPLGEELVGETAQKGFIRLFGAILKLKNILTSFDDFKGNEILSDRDFQDYQSMYLDLYQTYTRKNEVEKENINEDVVFEIELIKQIEVNIDYILMLVIKYHASNCTDKNILVDIQKAVDSSIELRSKKSLIEGFIARINTDSNVDNDWETFILAQRETDLTSLINEERLKQEETRRFVKSVLEDGVFKTTGTDVDEILPPVSRFSKEANRSTKKQRVIDKLHSFFDKYRGL
jgi:type I restriction enzyme R subunit